MKKMILLGVLVLQITQIYAQPQRQGKFGRQRPNKQELLKRFDLDGDGVLSQEERASAFKQRSQGQQSKQFGQKQQGQGQDNLDGDKKMKTELGRILKNLQKADPEKYKKLIKLFDNNSDGSLGDDEILNMVAERKMRKIVMKKFDKNQDGKLDDKEQASFENVHQERMRTLSQRNPDLYGKILDRFDANKSTTIDSGEWLLALRSGIASVPNSTQRDGRMGQQNLRGQGFERAQYGEQSNPQRIGKGRDDKQNPQYRAEHKRAPQGEDGGLLKGINTEQDQKKSGPEVSEDDMDLDFLDF